MKSLKVLNKTISLLSFSLILDACQEIRHSNSSSIFILKAIYFKIFLRSFQRIEVCSY
jgi:hypothetical protein